MPFTLATNNDAVYPDNPNDPSFKQHQKDHDDLARRFNLIVHADDPGNLVPQNGTSDCLSSLAAIVAAAPNIGTDPPWLLQLGARAYALSAVLDLTGKNIYVEGVPGYSNAAGIAGSRFMPFSTNTNFSLVQSGTSTISHQGQRFRGVGFANPNGNAGIKALYVHRTNRVWCTDCWFSEVDFGLHLDGALAFDNAWSIFRGLRFYHIGSHRSTGGARAIDLGNSYGAMWDDLEFIISATASGNHHAIVSDDSNGASAHQFSNMMFDGVNKTDNVVGIYLRYANHCHFVNAKMEAMSTGVSLDGNYPSSPSASPGGGGRGNFLRQFSFSQMANGLVVAAGAGDTNNGDGSGVDDFAFEDCDTPVTVAAGANGFHLGNMVNAGFGAFKQDPDVTGGAPTTTPDARYITHYIALLANCTTVNAPLHPRKGERLILSFQQDTTGGRTLPTFDTAYKQPAINNTGNTANKRWSTEYVYDGSVWIAVSGSAFMGAGQWW